MNARQLEKLGMPTNCVKDAILAVQKLAAVDRAQRRNIKQTIRDVLAEPEDFTADTDLGPLAGCADRRSKF